MALDRASLWAVSRRPLALPSIPLAWRKTIRRARVPLGFAFTLAFLALARPTPLSLALSAPLVAVGLLVRASAAGHLRKFEALSVTGPYAHTRNPLYLGSLLMAIGVGVASARPIFAVALAVVFSLVYTATILEEERHLVKRYEGFEAYARAVPRLWPRLSPARLEEGGGFSFAVYRLNREYQALLGCAAIYAFLVARMVIKV